MSLVTTPTRQLAVCASCSGTRCTSISMTLTDGTPVAFTSCHTCEQKTWTHGDHRLDVATVLLKAQKHKVAKLA